MHIFSELLTSPLVTLFLILALGVFIGQISVRGITLDISAIILVAIIFGHFGFSVPSILQELGLVLFIYSIGVQAGPGFISSLKSKGQKLALMATVSLIVTAVAAAGVAYLMGMNSAMAAGIFTGALSSAPGLAAANEASGSSLVSIGYSITYPAGILGVILLTKFTPNIMRVNIKEEEKRYKAEQSSDFPEIFGRFFVVENRNIIGQTIGSLGIRSMTGANISRIMTKGVASTPASGTVLHEGDRIKAVGTAEALRKMSLLIGRETDEEIPLTSNYDVRKVLVSNKNVVNRQFADLGFFEQYGATAARIRRSGIDLTPDRHTKIKMGDVITISAPKEQFEHIALLFGDSRKKLDEFNVLPIALTILVGVLIGKFSFPFSGVRFGLGLTGGVLISSLFFSYLGRTGPVVWNISGNTNQFIRKLGLMLFLASVGTKAGSTFAATFSTYGWTLILIGLGITIVPMVICVVMGRWLFGMNALTLLGGLTGSMTSTSALSAIESLSETDAAQAAYATAYPIALVWMIILSQLIVGLPF